MANLNRTTLIGYLGHEPEMRCTASGKAVASFTLATSERHKSIEGEYEEHTEWHNIVIWENLAEIAGQHLSKGNIIYIEGRLQTRNGRIRTGMSATQLRLSARKCKCFGGRYDENICTYSACSCRCSCCSCVAGSGGKFESRLALAYSRFYGSPYFDGDCSCGTPTKST